MGSLIRDLFAFRDEGEQRLIGAGKGKEYLVRSRTPPGAVDDLHLRRLQKVTIPHQEIDVLDAELDRKNSSACRGIVSEPMVRLVEPEERRFPNPIADATVEQRGPQRLASRHVLATQCWTSYPTRHTAGFERGNPRPTPAGKGGLWFPPGVSSETPG